MYKGRGGGWLLAAWPEMDSRSPEMGTQERRAGETPPFSLHTRLYSMPTLTGIDCTAWAKEL